MIRSVHLKHFKRFEDQAFDVTGNVVLAGPNNMGKTTLLQAISAWGISLRYWREAGDFNKHKGAYARVPVARQSFTAVPVRNFAWIWNDQAYRRGGRIIVVDATLESGDSIAMELIPDSTEQIYVRPRKNVDRNLLRKDPVTLTYVPPMSGLSIEEPVYQVPKLNQLLGMGRPGEIIRNLLLEAVGGNAWGPLKESIQKLFGVELLPPDGRGADIVANFRYGEGPPFDISSAGSGMQQVLLLLTFLHTRPGSVLLLDEPDAHLHVFLQDAIYSELKSVASQNHSQLILATHSEVIIDSVEPQELCLMLGGAPRRLGNDDERGDLGEALRVLSQSDVMRALDSPGVLYVEGHTDLSLLRVWARILGHPIHTWLSTKPFWKPVNWTERMGGKGVKSRDHFDALNLVRGDIRALEIVDGDGTQRARGPQTQITGQGYQRVQWRRYEIESYLVVPTAIERFISELLGPAHLQQAQPDLEAAYQQLLGSEATNFFANPLNPSDLIENYLETKKAREAILPKLLGAAGVHGVPYTQYQEIAEVMRPEEIHPEVKVMLDTIQQALGL